MFPNRGKTLQAPNCANSLLYAEAVAAALKGELGSTHRATKTIMKWTGASDRTAKNWLSGTCGPSGDHLVQLARESDAVLEAVLKLAGRQHHVIGADLLTIRQTLVGATSRIDALLKASGTP
jgi:hypothetical protein